MKSSRWYQTVAQITGSVGEIVLFLSGFFLGKGLMITAVIFLVLRMFNKIIISEFIYRRSKAVIREGLNEETLDD